MGILATALLLQAAGQVFDMGTTADRLVVLEAESGTAVNSATDTWTLVNAGTTPAAPVTTNSFVGTGAMVCLANDGGFNDSSTAFVNGPRLSFRCLFRQAGTYYIWVRGRGYDTPPNDLIGENDSSHVGLNGVAAPSGYRVSGFNATQWQWSRTREGGNASVAVPTVGVHTFHVYMREDGFMVDRVLITANSAYAGVTQGGTMNGPAASAQIPDQTPAAASAPAVVGGSFRVDVSWAPVTNADTYVLERSINNGAFAQVFSGAGLTYVEQTFDTTSDYCYRVRGVDNVFGSGPVSPTICSKAMLPPPRTKDHDEGFVDQNCACGSTVLRVPAAAWLLGLLLLGAVRRR
jgi:hypothetical protein